MKQSNSQVLEKIIGSLNALESPPHPYVIYNALLNDVVIRHRATVQ